MLKSVMHVKWPQDLRICGRFAPLRRLWDNMPCLRLGWGPYLFGGAAVSPAEAVVYRIDGPQTFSDRAASECSDDVWT